MKFYVLYENYYLVFAALKKNFTRLIYCLPPNCADKVKRKLPSVLQNSLQLPLSNLSEDPLRFNFAYTASLMFTTIKSDEGVIYFFEVLENLVDDGASKAVIEILRDGM